MRITRVHARRLALCAALVAAAAAPASAQSQLDTSQAQAFLGNWVMSLVTDMGPMDLQLNIRDQGGKVGAQFGSPALGALQEVTDITKQGEQLVMNLFIDAQGQSIDISMAIVPDADGLNVDLSAAGGAFTANARATRAAG
ncbi:MAG: hypothetical protein AB7T31_14600 [Gemmatimonadales bacterium]